MPTMKTLLTLSLLILMTACNSSTENSSDAEQSSITAAITAASTGPHRSDKHIARNQYRHPAETLAFFGLSDDMTVIEIHPGGMWYTEVLGPLLKDNGQLIVAGHQTPSPTFTMHTLRFTNYLYLDVS